jgi:hypothetical protein
MVLKRSGDEESIEVGSGEDSTDIAYSRVHLGIPGLCKPLIEGAEQGIFKSERRLLCGSEAMEASEGQAGGCL